MHADMSLPAHSSAWRISASMQVLEGAGGPGASLPQQGGLNGCQSDSQTRVYRQPLWVAAKCGKRQVTAQAQVATTHSAWHVLGSKN
jgi:hypothetical protein